MNGQRVGRGGGSREVWTQPRPGQPQGVRWGNGSRTWTPVAQTATAELDALGNGKWG